MRFRLLKEDSHPTQQVSLRGKSLRDLVILYQNHHPPVRLIAMENLPIFKPTRYRNRHMQLQNARHRKAREYLHH